MQIGLGIQRRLGNIIRKFTTLGERNNVALSTVTVSRKAHYGTTATLTISVGTGELSKNGGAWGPSVSIVPGDCVQARLTSSGSYETELSLTLSNADTFAVTTMIEPL